MLKEFDIRMADSKVDLVRIQETHWETSTDQETQNYRYISAAARQITGGLNEKGIGGVSIMVRKMEQ